MRKYYCDRCGEEIITRGSVKHPSPMQMRWRDIPTETNPTAWESSWHDLCGKCAGDIRAYLYKKNAVVGVRDVVDVEKISQRTMDYWLNALESMLDAHLHHGDEEEMVRFRKSANHVAKKIWGFDDKEKVE